MASRKITEYDALTAPASGDVLPIIDVSETLPENQNKKITIPDLTSQLAAATTSAAGIVQLNDTTSSTSTTEAATANAVKAAYDTALPVTGSNADGSYTRWSDGTQVCQIQFIELVRISTSGCTATWTFPAAFVAATYSLSGSLRPLNDGDGPADYVASCAPNVGMILPVTHGSRTATDVLLRVNRVAGGTDFSVADKVYASCIAVGRWF
jgi:hypothetical protein